MTKIAELEHALQQGPMTAREIGAIVGPRFVKLRLKELEKRWWIHEHPSKFPPHETYRWEILAPREPLSQVEGEPEAPTLLPERVRAEPVCALIGDLA